MKVADMHCDTILAILRGKEQGKEISLCKNNLNVDLERMKKGDYLIQNFAIFLDLEDPMLAGSPFRYAMKMADVFYREMEKNKDWIRPVTKYDEIEENRKNGKMSALLTLEAGEICEGDPSLLRDFYRMGARMMTLTWNYQNQLGYPAKATGGEFAGKAFSEAGYGNTAIDSGYGAYHAYVLFLGMLTGVGGGMFRDVLAGIMPAVLRKHVYACASLVGAIGYLGLLCVMPRGYAMFAGAVIVVVIRLLASHYKWNIPRVM